MREWDSSLEKDHRLAEFQGAEIVEAPPRRTFGESPHSLPGKASYLLT
jgi:hypothetical protein